MNILPKKRWHVRTKENIARVRRDEALAAEQTKIEQARIDKAESEARIHFLRNESRKKNNTVSSDIIDSKPEPVKIVSKESSKHINFFEELEQGSIDHTKTNKDYEKDKKEEQEKYEKQIGYLTYLGQGIKEAVSKSWYNELPKRINDTEKNIEIKPNKKALEDPMQDIKRYLNIISLKNNKTGIKVEASKMKPDIRKLNHEDIIVTGKKRKYKSATDDDSSETECRSSKKRKRKSSTSDESSEDEHRSGKKRKRKSSTSNDSSEDERRSRKKHKKKHKKHKKSKKHKREKEKEIIKPIVDIQQLRAERLEREKRERLRAQALLAQVKGKSAPLEGSSQSVFRQKYNSQFFPELARQNCEKDHR